MVKLEGTRFTRQQVGGVPDFNTAVVVAAEPFRRRGSRLRRRGGRRRTRTENGRSNRVRFGLSESVSGSRWQLAT